MAGLRFLSASNGFVPEPSGQMIAFVLDPANYALNRYCQYVESPTVVGLYAQLGLDAFIRIVSDEQFAWEDGDDAPDGEMNKIPFKWVEFRTFRRAYPWRIGYQQIDQTKAFKVKAAYTRLAESQCMVNRCNRVIKMLQTAANWGLNTADANVLNGGAGQWATGSDDPTSPNYLAIQKSLTAAALAINLATNGVVMPPDMRTVISPGLAIAMSQAPELVNYCRQTPDAVKLTTGGFDPQYSLFGVPRSYKGFELVVEGTPIVTEQAKMSGPLTTDTLAEATTNRQFIKSDSSAVMVSRPGGLHADIGEVNFSTCQLYHHKGLMKVFQFDDPENERVKGRVQESIKEVLAAPLSGYLITATK